ncbi:hypothetical protein [Levilactobacillus zymae]|uniref:hypothetical protein n=1 Tax=Levilactobacillus zymae TaxID=267363 RepID=UPI0028B8DA90|nr:hypothetical protein [Levilactobacillus zymae]MDT6979844.1 hypothetical protein [Levilactobacillus zymae]
MSNINLVVILIKYFYGIEDETITPKQIAQLNRTASNGLVILLAGLGVTTWGVTASDGGSTSWLWCGLWVGIGGGGLWFRHLAKQLGLRELRTTRQEYAERVRRLRRRAMNLGGGVALVLWGTMLPVADWRVTLGISVVVAGLLAVDTYQTWREHLTIID